MTTYKIIQNKFDYMSISGNTATKQSSFSETIVLASKTVPATVTRALPKDLWINGTTRTVSTEIQRTDFVPVFESPTNFYTSRAVSGLYTLENAALPSVSSPDRNLMYNQLRNELRGQKTNLAMMLAEYRKTAQLFADSASVVAQGTAGFARGFAGTKKASRNIAKKHLAWQYGVKPLTSDLIGSINELKNSKTPLVIGGIVRRRSSGRAVRDLGVNATTFSSPAKVETMLQYYKKTRWRATMRRDSLTTTLAAHGFLNPFALAWEVIPYSFVLDWWINVGEVLASLDNLTLCDSLYVLDSTRTVSAWYLSTSTSRISGKCSLIKVQDDRFAPASISKINTFTYKPSASLTHILNGLALLRLAKKG